MDLANRTILILGGSGLVGHAVSRRLLTSRPVRLVLVALFEQEVEAAREALEPHRGDTIVDTAWGNVFLPAEAAQMERQTMLADPALRRRVLHDLLDDMTPEILKRSFFYHLFERYRPDAVVDCINTATAFAYQDVFQSARDLLVLSEKGAADQEAVERHALTLTMPQLIRHVQIASETMREFPTRAYVKIGTSGTGGMGLNIPYTHSEERPSRTLLTKSAVAGAQSLLLFLMGRTPGLPSTHEVKPTSTICWREIGYGPIRRKGAPIPRVDCPRPIKLEDAFGDGAGGWVDTGEVVESVYINVGENGVFARDEFETVTSLGSMEFITPEEVAEYVVMELEGRPSGRDVVAALESATAGPTYRAGILRHHAIERLRELEAKHQVRPVGFEMLGPPRLTKNLYEAYILSRLHKSIGALGADKPEKLSHAAADLVGQAADLRSLIVSVGLPIIVPDGVYRGTTVIVPPVDGGIEAVVMRGWVDLRPANCATWIARARRVAEQAAGRAALPPSSGSDEEWGAMSPADPIEPSRFAAWIFKWEDGGERIKR